MKSVLVVAFLALVGLVSAQQFFTTTEITRIDKDEYFFCVPLGVVPTGEYNLAAQFTLEKAAKMEVKYTGSKLDKDLKLSKSVAVHDSELRTSTSVLPHFNEEQFLTNGCVGGIVESDEPLIKVIVAFMPKEITETREVPESSQTCGKYLVDAQHPEEKDDDEKKQKHSRPMPMVAILSLAAGVVLLVCAFLSCCCLCCRRRCQMNREQCGKQTVCASESTEMNVVTEQVPAVQETQAPQPVAAFYYVPAGAVNGGQYTPMQFVAPSATAYPGNAHVQFVAPK